MAQPSIGDKILFREINGSWTPLAQAYFSEAMPYNWKINENTVHPLMCQGSPLPYVFRGDNMRGEWTAPFYSGDVTFTYQKEVFKVFVYPDARKITLDQYNLMLAEILEEAAFALNIPISQQI